MKKIYLSSVAAIMAVAPALAAPSHSSNEFPSGGVMEEDYTYVGQANVTNLKVAEGTASTTASYQQCPTGWDNTDADATSTAQCYKACTTEDLPANSHAASASGKNYYGENETDTCVIATCNVGYTLDNGICNANTIAIVWDSTDAAEITANNAGSVTYDGNINTPRKAQHRNGYIFTGWTFNAPVQTYDFSQLDASTDGTSYDDSNMTWITNFEYGDVSGVALCSETPGTQGVAGTPDESNSGGNCWCKATGYKPSGENTVYENSSSSSWVFGFNDASASECASDCATSCGYYFRELADFRRAAFGITQ